MGPATRVRPAKSKHSSVSSWKPLPEEHARRWASRSIEHVFGGTTGQIRALIPPGPRGRPNPRLHRHTFRSFAAQTIRSLDGHDWLVRERVDASPHWVAEGLLDHGLAGLDALYGGASKAPDRERLAAIGIRLNWALVTTDAGERRDYDEPAFDRALHAHQALTVELTRLGEEVDQAFAAKPTPPGEDLVAALLARIEEMMRAHSLVRQERQAFEQLVAVERESALLSAETREAPHLLCLAGEQGSELTGADVLPATSSRVARLANRRSPAVSGVESCVRARTGIRARPLCRGACASLRRDERACCCCAAHVSDASNRLLWRE